MTCEGLTDEQKKAINDFKEFEQHLLGMWKIIKEDGAPYTVDKRWLSIARTHFEEGFMAMIRCIAQPETVEF